MAVYSSNASGNEIKRFASLSGGKYFVTDRTASFNATSVVVTPFQVADANHPRYAIQYHYYDISGVPAILWMAQRSKTVVPMRKSFVSHPY